MEYITSIAQFLHLSVEGEIENVESLSEVEREIRRQMMEAGRQALATYLKKQCPRYPAETKTCPYCGQEAGYVPLRAAKLHTMLGTMPPDNGAIGLDLGGTFTGKPLFHISPSQMNDDHISVHRLIGPNPKIGQSQLGFEVEVNHFTRPTPSVPLQDLFSRATKFHTHEVRESFGSRVPFGKENTDIMGHIS